MPATPRSRVRPLDMAAMRITQLAGKSAPPSRMAREVELIISGWEHELDGDIDKVKGRVELLHEALAAGAGDAEEQVGDVDRGDAAAVRQAQSALAALTTCRDAAARWIQRYG